MVNIDYKQYDYRVIKHQWPWIYLERWKISNPGHWVPIFQYDRKIRMKQVTFDKNYVFDNDDLGIKHYKHKKAMYYWLYEKN